jgi:hypothetical protein
MPTPPILNDARLCQARDRQFERFLALFAGVPAQRPFFLQGSEAHAAVDPYTHPEQWVHDGLESLASDAPAVQDERVFRPPTIFFNPYGVHFLDRILGARVHHPENGWWNDYLDSPIGELAEPDLDHSDTWQLAVRVAKAFVAADAALPLFGLPTIASSLNIAVNLYGDALLEALYESPGQVRRDLRIINDLLCRLHRWYLDNLPRQQLAPVVPACRAQPPGFGQICGCSTHLLSRAMYESFIAPLDDELLSVYPHGGMIHLCGGHAQHLPVWRQMKSLRSVQLNDRAADDLPAYLEGLRPDQVIYLNPTRDMTGPRAWEISRGRPMVLVTGQVF